MLALLTACAGPGPGPSPEPGPTGLSDPGPSESGGASARPPNVLLVVADELGGDKVAAYGEHPDPPPTPTLDALAARGVLFRNAWAYDTCSPSRSALLTGRYGRRTGVGGNLSPESGAFELPLRELTIPEVLATAPDAWATSAIGKWHQSSFGSPSNLNHPGAQGFDWYAVTMGNLDENSDPHHPFSYFEWEEDLNGALGWVTTYATTHQVDQAIDRIAAMPEPWFLYLAFNAPHKPLTAPPPALDPVDPGPLVNEPRLYHAVVQALDTELGRLLAEVDETDTVVLFVGDNGTPDHATLPPWDPAHAKETMFEGGVGVPLIVAGPPVAVPGSESAALVHVVDLFATVADLAGVDPTALVSEEQGPVPIDGQSLVPFLRDPAAPGREMVYTEHFRPLGVSAPRTSDQRAVRDARFKLMVGEGGAESLFDLAGRSDDGPNLLDAPLDPDAAAAYARLRAELDRYAVALVPY
ncbi:MAG: sulfatase-like hydrolase/transferase [Myxococcota bacterium]